MVNLGDEMKGKFVGPVSPSLFLTTFLPIENGRLEQMPEIIEATFQNVADKTPETAMYAPMVRLPLYSSCAHLKEPFRLQR